MRRASLQVKFGLSYILVIAAVLVFMNTYPLIVSENLVVRSKQTTLQSSVSVMVTALSGLEELSEENVASAMTLVEDTGISRILVTDAAGRILYDTRETDGAVGRYGLYTEIVQALRGYGRLLCRLYRRRVPQPRGLAGHLPQPDHRRGLCL